MIDKIRTGCSFEHFVCFTKSLISNKNSSLVTHSLGFAKPIQPGVHQLTKWSLKYFRENIKKGSTLFPQALTA